MTYFFYIATSLFLLTCQTSLIPRLAFIGHFFDLMLPLVVYLAGFRPLHESLPFVLFLGVLMDSLSGGPFGLFLTSYVWLFIAVRWAATLIRLDNPILLVLVLIAGVAFQNLLFLGLSAFLSSRPVPAGTALQAVSEQIGWVLLTGPVFVAFMRHVDRRIKRRPERVEAAEPSAAE
jgi:rod shape-determining protein MreD